MPPFHSAALALCALVPLTAMAVNIDPVVVTNTPSSPVPVAGNVSVTAAAPLPVSGSVSVTAPAPLPVTGSVAVSNGAASPLYTSSLGEPARRPVQVRFLTVPGAVGSDTDLEFRTGHYQVPAGTRLVVQQFTGLVGWNGPVVPVGVRIWTDTPASNPPASDPYPSFAGTPTPMLQLSPPTVDDNHVEWIATQGPIYVDGGTTLWFSVRVSSPGAAPSAPYLTKFVDLSMQGYLIDCTAAACMPAVAVTQ